VSLTSWLRLHGLANTPLELAQKQNGFNASQLLYVISTDSSAGVHQRQAAQALPAKNPRMRIFKENDDAEAQSCEKWASAPSGRRADKENAIQAPKPWRGEKVVWPLRSMPCRIFFVFLHLHHVLMFLDRTENFLLNRSVLPNATEPNLGVECAEKSGGERG